MGSENGDLDRKMHWGQGDEWTWGLKEQGSFLFSAEARPHFTIKLYKHKLEVELKYIYLVQVIELENTMEINSPAALLKSPEVSLSLPQAITREKLPVWFLKYCTMEKKKKKKRSCNHWSFVVSDVLYQSKLWLHQCPHFPLVSFEGMQVSCSFPASG